MIKTAKIKWIFLSGFLFLCFLFMMEVYSYSGKDKEYKFHYHLKGDTYYMYEVTALYLFHGEGAYNLGDTLCIFCNKTDSTATYPLTLKIKISKGIKYGVQRISDSCTVCPYSVSWTRKLEKNLDDE